jgi:hypothetical protein
MRHGREYVQEAVVELLTNRRWGEGNLVDSGVTKASAGLRCVAELDRSRLL